MPRGLRAGPKEFAGRSMDEEAALLERQLADAIARSDGPEVRRIVARLRLLADL